MKYGSITCIQADQFAREGRRLWACAYKIDNQTLYPHLRQEPVEGMITPEWKFAPFGVNGKLRSSGRVSYDSRQYADTYGEAIELYNELVTKRRKALEQIADTVYDDYVLAPYIPRRGGWHPIEEPPMDELDVQVTYLRRSDGKPRCNAFAYRRNGAWYWTHNDERITAGVTQLTAWRFGGEPYHP